jgi:hypothetical protein
MSQEALFTLSLMFRQGLKEYQDGGIFHSNPRYPVGTALQMPVKRGSGKASISKVFARVEVVEIPACSRSHMTLTDLAPLLVVRT